MKTAPFKAVPFSSQHKIPVSSIAERRKQDAHIIVHQCTEFCANRRRFLRRKIVRCSIKGKTISSIIGEGLYVVPERKRCSGTILDFGLRISDSKKKAISVRLVFSGETGTPYFEVFVQTLSSSLKFIAPRGPL